jgi:hypothetical protein
LERLAAFPTSPEPSEQLSRLSVASRVVASRSTNTATRGVALKLVQDPCALMEVDDANAGNDWSTMFVAAWFAGTKPFTSKLTLW